jgi:hypothetical protein
MMMEISGMVGISGIMRMSGMSGHENTFISFQKHKQ